MKTLKFIPVVLVFTMFFAPSMAQEPVKKQQKKAVVKGTNAQPKKNT